MKSPNFGSSAPADLPIGAVAHMRAWLLSQATCPNLSNEAPKAGASLSREREKADRKLRIVHIRVVLGVDLYLAIQVHVLCCIP